MAIDKQPFRMYRSEEEIAKDKSKSATYTVRLNGEEQRQLKELKQMFGIHMDSTAIKTAMQIGYNVLHGFLGTKTMAYLTSKTRRREEI